MVTSLLAIILIRSRLFMCKMAASTKRGTESMASDSSSSWSNSSDDETEPNEKLRRFQDAAVTAEYFSGNKTSSNTQTADNQLKKSLPSRRCSDVNDHEDENPLKTTPEFRAFVAKKLAEKLDREIEFCVMDTPASEYVGWLNQDPRAVDEGVRLYSDSCVSVCNTEEENFLSPPQKPQKPHNHHHQVRIKELEGDETERLASVAVTADFLREEQAMWARLAQSSQGITTTAAMTTTSSGILVSTATTAHKNGPHHKTGKKKKKKKNAKDVERKNSVEQQLETGEKSGKKRKNSVEQIRTGEEKTDKEMTDSMKQYHKSGKNQERRKKGKHKERKGCVESELLAAAESSCNGGKAYHSVVEKKRKSRDASPPSSKYVSKSDAEKKAKVDTESNLCEDFPKKKKKHKH